MAPKRAMYLAALSLSRVFGPHRFFHSRVINRLLWDEAPRDALLISHGTEKFIVSAGDATIGRAVFLERAPFNFAKLERVVEILKQRRIRTLVDVRANIDTICIPAVRRGFLKRAIATAIEPEPMNHSLLVANITINGLADSITTYNLALGANDDESISFEPSNDNFGDHRPRYGEADASRQSIKYLLKLSIERSSCLETPPSYGWTGRGLTGMSWLARARRLM